MSLGRLLQVRDMVIEAQVDEQRRQLAIRQQELRIMAGYTAAAGTRGSSELVRAAGEITLLAPLDDDGRPAPDRQPPPRPVPLSALRRALGG